MTAKANDNGARRDIEAEYFARLVLSALTDDYFHLWKLSDARFGQHVVCRSASPFVKQRSECPWNPECISIVDEILEALCFHHKAGHLRKVSHGS